MTTAQRKQRELAQRDDMLLDQAQELLEESGFSNLTLDKLAARTEFSKGTIYNHFSSKEDLLTALCIRGLQIQLAMYLKAVEFPGNSREKVIGLHYAYNLYARIHPTLFMCVLSGLAPHVIEKTSAKRMEERRFFEGKVTAVLDRLVQQALESGHIASPLACDAATVAFANWAVGFGTTALLQSAKRATSIERLDSNAVLRRNVDFVLDGLLWHPLSHAWDYEATWLRLSDYFDEQALLGSRLLPRV
ncbi:TetR/AcrR family transcriptional regulator [Chitiniphilus purpureus]|uniref:TetR/AcrR family transcriptional regulator n=1 Tax=Chitiniphilus purpureus TaxID=2981137 RepID=A0ABY6DTS9_9NEIS|nr:TetR/AcrR family transcriptional regulator [Chitiniphilus sp. CD1]UXY17138.1 TetR/AcrR family transcriptional regulator [Chitiniphilus sp. CD1]